MSAVLLATLGSEPQVIALAAQLLLRRAVPLTHVVVLHTSAARPPVCDALPALSAAFAAHPHWSPLRAAPIPGDDVLTPHEIDAFADVLYQTLKQWIARGAQIHLLLAGGRKPMAMVGITVAQLLLGGEDRVWYLHSGEALRQAGRFVLEPDDDAQLIAIPLPQFSLAPPRFTEIFRAATPDAARQMLAAGQARRVRHFVEHELTPAERVVAALVAQDLLTVAEIAARLSKTPKTVTNQLNSIYSKLESAFGLQPDVGLKREFLRRELGAYFAQVGS